MDQKDAVASLHKSLGVGKRVVRPTPAAKRREIQAAQVQSLENVLTDIRRRARETPAWANAYNSAATAVELEIAAVKGAARAAAPVSGPSDAPLGEVILFAGDRDLKEVARARWQAATRRHEAVFGCASERTGRGQGASIGEDAQFMQLLKELRGCAADTMESRMHEITTFIDSRPTYIKDADQQGGLCASILAAMYAGFQRGDSVDRVHAAVMGLIGSEDSRAKVHAGVPVQRGFLLMLRENLNKMHEIAQKGGASTVGGTISGCFEDIAQRTPGLVAALDSALASTTPQKADNE